MHLLAPFLAGALARDREVAAEHAALLAQLREPGASTGRRLLARTFAAVSLASAAAVRRLDACLADDLVSGRARA